MRLIFDRRPDGVYTAHEADTPDDMAIHVESATPEGLVGELLQVVPPRETRAMIEAGLSLGLFLAGREDLNWTIPFIERPRLPVAPKVSAPDPVPAAELKRMIPLGVDDWTEALHIGITKAIVEWFGPDKSDPKAIVLADRIIDLCQTALDEQNGGGDPRLPRGGSLRDDIAGRAVRWAGLWGREVRLFGTVLEIMKLVDTALVAQRLTDEAIRIYESELPWETKYDLIFSDEISVAIFNIVDLDYYNPDTSYEEDVRAFVMALKKRMGRSS